MKKYLAEFIGTFALVFFGTGAIVVEHATPGSISSLGIGLTFGLVIAVMIFALGDISGAHFNPGVTVALTFVQRMPLKDCVPYILSQLAGAFAASGLIKFIFPNDEYLGATLPSGPGMQSFIIEVVITMVLVLVILNVTTGAKEKGITAAIAIGSAVGIGAILAGPVSGGSMNLARSLAPALVSGHTEYLWLYISAPLAGALIAALLHKLLYNR